MLHIIIITFRNYIHITHFRLLDLRYDASKALAKVMYEYNDNVYFIWYLWNVGKHFKLFKLLQYIVGVLLEYTVASPFLAHHVI